MAAGSLPKAVLLMGPTASGKTDLAMLLADRFAADIISVDSVMVYRGMNIGSAKPDAATLARYPHQLVDIRDPAEPYSAAEFREDALQAMHASARAGRIPLLVGGTMMYYKALWQGIADMPGADEGLRAELVSEAEKVGWAAMHERLRKLDPVAAERIHPNNRQRIQRALEVCLTSGKPFSSFWGVQEGSETEWDRQQASPALPFDCFSLALAPAARDELHERINRRFDLMLQQGLVDEVQGLYSRGDLSTALPSVRAVGYRQVWDYLDGNSSYDLMVEKGKAATRQLAKRQMTWLRSWPGIQWCDVQDQSLVEQTVENLSDWLQ